MSATHGTIHWNELNTRDVAGAKAYYGQVLGWAFETMPMDGGGEYTVGRLGDDMVAGIFDMTGTDIPGYVPAHWPNRSSQIRTHSLSSLRGGVTAAQNDEPLAAAATAARV